MGERIAGSDEVIGSNPLSSTNLQDTATGNNQPDSGFLLPETAKYQEVTESATDQTGNKSTNTGNETSETGTANPLLRHCKSTDKSTAINSYHNGLEINLWNNTWGTNFPMFYDNDAVSASFYHLI